MYTVYGREVTANLLPIDVQAQDIKVSGFIGKPLIARGNRNYENYFINGRYIKSSIISKAIEEAYKPYMMQHKYPFTLLHFSIEPEFLDVNVHPTKMELRFRDGELMFKTVLNAVGEALSHRELIPLVSLEEKRAREEAQQKERLTPRPEPFEVRRRQTLENGGTTDRKSESISPLSSNNSGFDAHTPPQAVQNPPIDYRLIPHKSQNQLRETSWSWNGSAAAPGKAARPASHAADLERELFGGAQEPENQPVDCKLPADLAQAVLSGSGTDFAAMPGTDFADKPGTDFADKPGTGFPATPGGVTADGHEATTEDHPAASHSAGPQPERAPRAASQGEETSGTADASPEQLDLFDTKFLDPKSRLRHKLIGQLFDTYWLVEYDGMLVIIDQHAAHEKILYENTMKSLKTRQYDTQMVNPPIILTLSMNEELLLNKYMDYFTNLGFEIENFGGREYAVRGVPANLFSIAKRELLIEMIDGLSDEAAVRNPDIIYEKVASMSCKAAVKGHMSMSAMEANELIDQLLHLDNPYNCPHGRPVIISMTKYELEKKFKRIV